MKLQGAVKHCPSIINTIVLLFTLLPCTTAFQFYLHSGEQRCFTESVPVNTKVLGEYTVSTGEGTMVVDMLVTIPEENLKLYHKQNIGHGKFAFVVPFPHAHEKWHVLSAEMKQKEMLKKVGDVLRQQAADAKGNTGRKLLSTGYGRGDSIHERQFDEYGRAKPPAGYDGEQKADTHEGGYQERHHRTDDNTRSWEHEHDNPEFHHDHDFYDDFDDYDMDDYDGIHDEELDDEVAEEEAVYIKEMKGDVESREQEVPENRKFEICVTSDGAKNVSKRRIRLVIHRGETAHDYTRLAKREHMTHLEVSMRRISDELHELTNELMKAQRLEDSLREINEQTNRRVGILAAFSIATVALVSGYQAMYTKRFLKRKKVV